MKMTGEEIREMNDKRNTVYSVPKKQAIQRIIPEEVITVLGKLKVQKALGGSD